MDIYVWLFSFEKIYDRVPSFMLQLLFSSRQSKSCKLLIPTVFRDNALFRSYFFEIIRNFHSLLLYGLIYYNIMYGFSIFKS